MNFTIRDILDKCETKEEPCCCFYCQLAERMKREARTHKKTLERQIEVEAFKEFHDE